MEQTGTNCRYCVECGAQIPPGSDFCYACGAVASAPASPSRTVYNDQGTFTTETHQVEQTITISPMDLARSAASSISIFIRIWAIIALAMGLISFAVGQEMADVYYSMYNLKIDVAQIYYEASFLVASGATAMLASVLTKKLIMFPVAFISCLVAAATSYMGVGQAAGIITTLIGLYMTYQIYRLRGAFKR